jgi:hypothetical protein
MVKDNMAITRAELMKELLPGINQIFGQAYEIRVIELDKLIMMHMRGTPVREEVQSTLCILMNMEQQELGLNHIWRLEIVGDFFRLNDFTLPSQGDTIDKLYEKEDIPKWMLESLAVMQILDDQTNIAKVGHKINDTIYYLVEPIKD